VKNENKIEVFIYPPNEQEAVPAGQYRYEPKSGAGIFVYSRDYLKSKKPLAVDPLNLPLEVENNPVIVTLGHEQKGRRRLYGVLRDSLPDSWGRILMTYLHGLPMDNPAPESLLRFSNNQRVGNLDFRETTEDKEKTDVPLKAVDWENLISTAFNIERGIIKPPERDGLLYLERTSLGGARPKTLFFDGQFLWLAKLPSCTDIWNEARIEFAATLLGKRCGLNTSEMKIEATDLGDVLLSKRFDRIYAQPGFSRIGYFSCQTALESLGVLNLERSYINYVDVLRTRFPENWNRPMAEELFRRLCFNILVRNTDDHPLNHGVLYSHEGISPSPAFDLFPDYLRKEQVGAFDLSMACGPFGKKAEWRNVLAGAGHFGLSGEKAASIIRSMAEQVRDWRGIFAGAGVSEEDMTKIEGSLESPLHQEALELEPYNG